MQPIPSEHLFDARVRQVEEQGYTVVPGAIPPPQVAAMRERFDELIGRAAALPTAVRYAETGGVDLNRIIELDPVFVDLIDLPSMLPYVEKIHAGDVRLLGGPIGNFMPPGEGTRGAWHRDGGPYTRFTFLLSDLEEHGGPTAVVPGTHRSAEGPPAWSNDDRGRPRALPGMVKVAGRAGDCMINNTNVWHTSTPNRAGQPRRIVWVVYKRQAQAMPPPSQYNLLNTPEFFARQTDPRRRRLLELAVAPTEPGRPAATATRPKSESAC
jgi:ectoine hydroxylase-related dioxygenase (phytanoyl-CoA dioxygenase family)